MYERLKDNIETLSTHNERHIPVFHITDGKKPETDLIREIVSDCREILNKIEQGTLIELPCKVGDSFYSYEGLKYTCYGVEIGKDGIYLRTVYDMKFLFGKDAFLTREEAEKRLLELQGETKL